MVEDAHPGQRQRLQDEPQGRGVHLAEKHRHHGRHQKQQQGQAHQVPQAPAMARLRQASKDASRR